MFASIEEKLAQWQSLQPLKAEDEKRLWQKLRLEWNYHSNHIEGNTLTYGETVLLLLHGQAAGDHTLRDYEEMKAHDVAIAHLRRLAEDDRPLTEADVRDLNRILLKEPFYKPAVTAEGLPTRTLVIPGEYKTQPNNVRTPTGEIFEFVAPADVQPRMAELVALINQTISGGAAELFEKIAKVHHEFVLIHPFGDGNGRTARLLVNFLLLRARYLPLIVPTTEKDRYLAALRRADAGNLGPFIEYLAKCAKRSLDWGINAAHGRSIEEPEDLDKEIAIFLRNANAPQSPAPGKSKELLRERLQDSWIPLFEEFENAHEILRKLFREITVESNVTGISPQGATWQEALRRSFESPDIINHDHVALWLYLKDFVGTPSFSLRGGTGIWLEPNRWGIISAESVAANEPNPKAHSWYRYDETLPENRQKAIAREFLRMTFEEIKRQGGQTA